MSLLFSVVVPTLGSAAKLSPLIAGLARQDAAARAFRGDRGLRRRRPRARDPERARRDRRHGSCTSKRAAGRRSRATGARRPRPERSSSRRTTTSCPEPDWLARAAERIAAEPDLDVIEGLTVKPGGRPVRVRADDRRSTSSATCSCVAACSRRSADSTRATTIPKTASSSARTPTSATRSRRPGARVAASPAPSSPTPIEHPGFLDPLRWAQRYEMDALLAARYPDLFRERIEVHRLGPFTIRRPVVRACFFTCSG
jgi:hypothetical protein